ncbi:XRE family transcriptional regulator [Microbacterium sp. NPDC076911]|uniref:helix-turn-helix domain-containing protein n=1 Tax=Microbacterium sp. NPDC076911 TaxID=3154958 RepID=UPI0034405C82
MHSASDGGFHSYTSCAHQERTSTHAPNRKSSCNSPQIHPGIHPSVQVREVEHHEEVDNSGYDCCTRTTGEDVDEDGLPTQIGARLRKMRAQSGRSLVSVAAELGISASALSQIETGVMQPSVNRLVELVAVLGAPISTIFDDASIFKPSVEGRGLITEPIDGVLVAHANDVPAAHLGQGVTYRRLSPAALPGVEWFESTYPPGASSSIDGAMLVHPGYESGHVTFGELTFEFTEGAVTLSCNESLSFVATRPHRVVNATDQLATAIWLTVAVDTSVATGAD